MSAPTRVKAAQIGDLLHAGDRFKPLPGYQVMGSHYHVGLVERLEHSGSKDTRLNDIDAIKGAGINIYGIIDSSGGAIDCNG